MFCKNCNVLMKCGTTYFKKLNSVYKKAYYECPKCHDRIEVKNKKL